MLIDAYTVFDNVIKSTIDESTTCRLVNAKNKRPKERMTNVFLTSARRKQYLFVRRENNLWLTLLYKKYKNSFTKTTRMAKLQFYEQQFKTVSSNQKLTWKLVNEVTSVKFRPKDEIIKLKYNEIELNARKDPIYLINIANSISII